MKFRYVLFDLDGTLSESAPGITKSVQYALSALGIDEPDLKKLETFVGPPLNVEFRRLYHFDDDTTEFAVMKYREYYTKNNAIFDCNMYPGTEEMLIACKEAGIRMAVASSKPHPFVIRILENYGILSYFDIVIGSGLDDEKRAAGTDQKTFIVQTALEKLRMLDACTDDESFRQSCSMVGDRSFDIIGAKENHVCAIGVTFGYGSKEELISSGADCIAHSMEELRKILTE